MRLERLVPTAAPPASCDEKSLPVLYELTGAVHLVDVLEGYELLLPWAFPQRLAFHFLLPYPNHSPHRHIDDLVLARFTVHRLAFAMLATGRLIMRFPLQMLEGVVPSVAPQNDMAAMTTVSAIWSPEGHVGLAPEGLAAQASIPSLHVNHGHVEIPPIAVVPLRERRREVTTHLEQALLRALIKHLLQLRARLFRQRRLWRQSRRGTSTCD
mmetsp:Transcript_2650/g.6707  ORF Transcript_2650/g.6707 Transcript_2650/m.6707 type:complete len:212 (+) Transcript_2650:1146-1781(+)